MLQFVAPLADITPSPRWCPASESAQPQFVLSPVACTPADNLSVPSPPRHVRTAWHHRLGGFPTCTAMSEGHDEERNQKQKTDQGYKSVVHIYGFSV